jgi:hypothetical protein
MSSSIHNTAFQTPTKRRLVDYSSTASPESSPPPATKTTKGLPGNLQQHEDSSPTAADSGLLNRLEKVVKQFKAHRLSDEDYDVALEAYVRSREEKKAANKGIPELGCMYIPQSPFPTNLFCVV